jgi:phosphate-selective porin OprO/OprP
VQLDYRKFAPSKMLADTFGLRRVRTAVDATLYKDFRIMVEAEYANGNATGTTPQNVALTNGFFDVGLFGPGARIRLGQFKPAFGYEQTILDLYSDYMERSFAQSLLQNMNYDRGVMVYGTPISGLWYGLTLGNGVGQNLEEKQANPQEVKASKPEITARLTANFAQFFGATDRIYQVGISHRNGDIANSPTSPYTAASVQTEARGITYFTPTAFNALGETASNIDREFVGFEYLFALGGVKLQGEHVNVTYAGTRTSPAPDLSFERELQAEYVSLMWLVTGENYADFFRDSTIGKIRPSNRFVNKPGGGWGALELGLRYSRFDGTEFASTNPPRTGLLGATAPTLSSTNKASALTLQIKWIPNVYTRFWFDAVNTDFDTPVVVNGVTTSNERAYLLRAQIDF